MVALTVDVLEATVDVLEAAVVAGLDVAVVAGLDVAEVGLGAGVGVAGAGRAFGGPARGLHERSMVR